MGHNTANSAGNNEPEDDPEPFTQNRCSLDDGCLSHFFRFYLSDPGIRHTFPASEGAAVTLEATGFAGLVTLIPDTFGEFTVASKRSSRTYLAARTIQLLFLRTFSAGFPTIGFCHFLSLPFCFVTGFQILHFLFQ